MDSIGALIRSHRKGKGLTQADLGRLVGVSKQAISNWENDLVNDFKFGEFSRLLVALEISEADPLSKAVPKASLSRPMHPDETPSRESAAFLEAMAFLLPEQVEDVLRLAAHNRKVMALGQKAREGGPERERERERERASYVPADEGRPATYPELMKHNQRLLEERRRQQEPLPEGGDRRRVKRARAG